MGEGDEGGQDFCALRLLCLLNSLCPFLDSFSNPPAIPVVYFPFSQEEYVIRPLGLCTFRYGIETELNVEGLLQKLPKDRLNNRKKKELPNKMKKKEKKNLRKIFHEEGLNLRQLPIYYIIFLCYCCIKSYVYVFKLQNYIRFFTFVFLFISFFNSQVFTCTIKLLLRLRMI